MASTLARVSSTSAIMVPLPAVAGWLAGLNIAEGWRAYLAAIAASQVISNVPATILLDRYVTPAEFRWFYEQGMALGFRHVESAPLVRSSYHAWEQVQAAGVQ